MNKTDTPYGKEIGQMKPVLRFFAMNFLRAFYSNAEREYIRPTRG